MSQVLKVIDELEAALKTSSARRHQAILQSITSLFLAGRGRITQDMSAVFDDVIVRLVEHVESRARVELSRELAPMPDAPQKVVHRLASDDDIAVAGPMLAQSPQLSDQVLIEIAASKGQPHLSKIAERAQISATVTDVLVDRGDPEVVNKVAANSGAQFSRTGMSMLMMRARGDTDLTYTMSRRADISPVLFKRLLSHATEEARQRMLAAARPQEREAINRVLTQLANQAGSQTVSPKEFAAAQRLVHSFSQDTAHTRSKVLQFADGNRIAELVAALSILSGVPIVLVSRLICDSEPFGAMVMCKAIGLEWMVAHAVLDNLPGMQEDRDARFEQMEDEYKHLSCESACRLMSYWQACQLRSELP